MQPIKLNGLFLWQFNLLKEEPEINHFVSDRHANGGDTDFTLSYSSTPDKEAIKKNRNYLALAMGEDCKRLIIPSQIHSSRIVTVDYATTKEDLSETDAVISNKKGICIAVLAADCVPVLIYDRINKAVGAVHSGWRGTVAKILEKTLLEMQRNFGSKGSDLIACIGPSICQDVYEVGEEVAEQFYLNFGSKNELLIPLPNKKAKVDLWKANKLQLLSFGVPDANIEIAKLCTTLENKNFFSARKGDSGRFAAGIMLK